MASPCKICDFRASDKRYKPCINCKKPEQYDNFLNGQFDYPPTYENVQRPGLPNEIEIPVNELIDLKSMEMRSIEEIIANEREKKNNHLKHSLDENIIF